MTAQSPSPWDPGLQNERTALAWVRSVLALLAVSLIAARVAVDDRPVLALILAGVALAVSAVALRYSYRRYRTARTALFAAGALPDGRAPLAVTALVVVLGVSAVVLIVA